CGEPGGAGDPERDRRTQTGLTPLLARHSDTMLSECRARTARGFSADTESCTIASMDLERYVRELSERQHGVVGRRQLWGNGFTAPDLRGLEARAAIEHLSPETLRVVGAPFTPLSRAMAAVLDAPSGAVISH